MWMTISYTELDGRVKSDQRTIVLLQIPVWTTKFCVGYTGNSAARRRGVPPGFEEVRKAVKPLLAAAATEAPDDQLVAAVRDGSEQAFETLYRRYRPRIVAYVRRMCSDHARAEDVAQDAFMSALRGLRSSDKEIVFRPWLYEIAKNACIDHMRRAGRSAEVSIDSDDFSPQEEVRISQSVSGTDAQVRRRKELESLQMAFGDLPQSQHEILVMREFEGLSYDRIGMRMGISRGAVESLLFRARRTLRDGFDEIDTGERCLRMRSAMEAAADGRRTGMRERRRLTIHLRDCAACRRTAVTIGLDELALAAARSRGSALRRVAGLLPLPAFLRRRIEDAGAAMGSIGPAAEQGASLAAKATAVVVVAALAAGGAGVANKASGGAVPLPGGLGGGSGTQQAGPGSDNGADGGGAAAGDPVGGSRGTAAGGSAGSSGGGSDAGSGSGQVGSDGRGGDQGPLGGAAHGGLGGATDGARGTAGALGGAIGGTTGAAGGTTGTVGSLLPSPGKTIDQTSKQVTGVVDKTVQGVTGGKTPQLPAPKVEVPDAGVTLPGSGGGSSQPPDAGGALGGVQNQLPVQTPRVDLPKTGVTVPGTGVRLP
jgi:RNA polymerase sigma factor (sigma-70 family)